MEPGAGAAIFGSTRFCIAVLCCTWPACAALAADEGVPSAADPEVLAGGVTDRPVIRSVLDGRPRVASIPLADSVWVAYDTAKAGLYKLWSEGVNWQGAVYNAAHGPQPSTKGGAWFADGTDQPWSVVIGDEEVPVEVEYRGHRYDDRRSPRSPELVYRLSGESFEITVAERPRLFERDGRMALERVFSTDGVPDNASVRLRFELQSLASADALQTDGRLAGLETTPGTRAGAFAAAGRLVLAHDGETRLTAWLAAEPQVPAPAALIDESKARGLRLIEQGDCVVCHNPKVRTVGPSWHAIAKKYPHDDATIVRLADRVIAGGSGVWGTAVMTAHPRLSADDAATMVGYILGLDGEERESSLEAAQAGIPLVGRAPTESERGVAVNVFVKDPGAVDVADAYDPEAPLAAYVAPAIHAVSDEDFGSLSSNFYLEARGFIAIERPGEYHFRLVSDDGSTLELDGEPLIDNDGSHGAIPRDAAVTLERGRHAFLIRFFQGTGGKALSLQWRPPGVARFAVVPPEALTHDAQALLASVPDPALVRVPVPGFGSPLAGVHPSFDLVTVRPEWFQPMVGGLDVFDDGRLAVSTWDREGSVYVLSNVDAADPADIVVQRIAHGLAEPLGLKIVDDEIYVLQKQELTRLVDLDGDGVTDFYETVSNDWTVTANFHEFAFGLEYVDGNFYAALATAILPGGASAPNQAASRGSIVRISPQDGSVEFVARGLRTPNGIGVGPGGDLFVTDNQGDWLPSSKLVKVEEGAFYGSRSVDFEGTAGLPVTPPVVWLPQDEIGNSPSQPVPLDAGPYRGQLIHGDVTHGGIKRVFLEEIDGVLQGAVFRFSQGFEAGVNRLARGPDGALYVGGIGNPGNWGQEGKQWFGLQRLTFNSEPVFEMLAVRAKTNGFEIEFTEPLQRGDGRSPADYEVRQWRYVPTAEYGGPKVDERELPVRSVTVSDDRRRVFLELAGLREGHVVHIRLAKHFISRGHRELWSGDAWYTLNAIPEDDTGPGDGT